MLTSKQVAEIGALLTSGQTPEQIAKAMGFKSRQVFLYALSQAGYRIKSSRGLNPITPVRPEEAENA